MFARGLFDFLGEIGERAKRALFPFHFRSGAVMKKYATVCSFMRDRDVAMVRHTERDVAVNSLLCTAKYMLSWKSHSKLKWSELTPHITPFRGTRTRTTQTNLV